MSRILIDTDELRSMARDFRPLAKEVGDINLDLVRGWSHTLALSTQLRGFAARSERTQVEMRNLCAEVMMQALSVDAEAMGAELREGRTTDYRVLATSVHPIAGTWARFRRWEDRTRSRFESAALKNIRGVLKWLSTPTPLDGHDGHRYIPDGQDLTAPNPFPIVDW